MDIFKSQSILQIASALCLASCKKNIFYGIVIRNIFVSYSDDGV